MVCKSSLGSRSSRSITWKRTRSRALGGVEVDESSLTKSLSSGGTECCFDSLSDGNSFCFFSVNHHRKHVMNIVPSAKEHV